MSYVHNDRVYYFAGENVVQDFTSPRSQENTARRDELGTTGKSAFKRTMDTVNPTPSMQNTVGFDNRDTPAGNNLANTDQLPEDLGPEFVQMLSGEYRRVRQINVTDPNVLFDFWKQLKKARAKEQSIKTRSATDFNKTKTTDLNATGGSNVSSKMQNVRYVTQQREGDVLYTLQQHKDILKRDDDMKKFIMAEVKRQQSLTQTKKKKFSKESQERLYQTPETSIRKSKQPPQDVKEKECKEFVQKLIENYKANKPNDKGYTDPGKLLDHWKQIPNKSELQLNLTEDQADEHINNHTDKKLQKVDELRKAKHGYYTEKPTELSTFYRKELKEEDRQRNEVELEETLIDPMFETYCERKRVKREADEQQMREEQELKERKEKETLKKKVLRNEPEKTDLNDLAKPKDRLKVGKSIMSMAKMFPNDKILKKLLINEFQEKKLPKYPEEYDIYDSDEEAEIKGRDILKEPYKTIKEEHREFLTLADLNRSQRIREKEITEPFQTQLQKYMQETQQKIKKDEEAEKEYNRQDKLLERFIMKSVNDFLEMRKKRVEQKTFTLKEFLTKCYKEMKSTHPQAVKRRFPHITYGYSKRLKENSFPFEFKKYFFYLLRSIARGNKLDHGKKLLPFWAPPSAGATKHGLDRVISLTHNKKVQELSREVIINKIESNFEQKTAWDKVNFNGERLNFMMTFSDAQNCTFYPKTGSNIPIKYKKHILRAYESWATQMMETKAGSFDEWVGRMGPNFLKRFPTIYKYGKFNKARLYLRRDQYIKAYKEIAESFNIPSIKKFYEAEYNAEKEKKSMFSRENLRLEEVEMPQEDFDDDANKRFLDEVYSMIKFIELREQDLKNQVKAYSHQLDHEQKKAKAQTQGAAGVGTVQLSKHDKVRSVMFPFKDDPLNVTKYGPKSDDIAYRVFDLRFSQEVKARRKMLKTVLNNVSRQFEKDPETRAWNPGGSKVIQRTSERMAIYRKLAKKKYLELVKDKNFNAKIKQLHQNDERLNKKLGLFRKANVYYTKEMYNDAFKAIVKAVEIVKVELEQKEEQESTKAREWRQKLALPLGTSVTYEMLLKPDNEVEGETTRSEDGAARAKLWVLAEKTGLLGGKSLDVNEFLNYQIEEAYKKIEKALANKAKDVEILRNKAEKLENEEGEDVDPMLLERQINDLTKAAELRQKKIAEGKPPAAWNPTSAQDAILKIEDYDNLVFRQQVARNPEKAKKQQEKMETLLQSKFYEKDIDDISRLPFERPL